MKSSLKKFILVGASGYIAPRHISAISFIGGVLTAAVDISFTKESLARLPRNTLTFSSLQDIPQRLIDDSDYLVVCSPNFLHEIHILEGLKLGLEVISEKPVALTEKGLKKLRSEEDASEGKVNCILQLRLHPLTKQLKRNGQESSKTKIELIYVAKRDNQYFETWKGDSSQSGGVLTNLGVHYFDLLLNNFGDCIDFSVEENSAATSKGVLSLQNATVKWLISLKKDDIDLYNIGEKGAFRSITLNSKKIEFSKVSKDLHMKSYEKIIQGKGFSLKEAEPSIKLIDRIKNTGTI